ncbi:fumarylacetoacetate hydrolase family protein [Sphaerobacter sp.]|uniref:fumarylacetoacetate hydrolase family protein n=1 Tax=Sphaerobacter sp. TaxID=2099654 RepID=UPI001D9C3D17|nr:fumarylacetoacetate hydrolase family protein [Sphaerobacter sp.]MBX5445233.1 fumarylacetoacetate hydrolase family protein [Sphaerobacter sp.]
MKIARFVEGGQPRLGIVEDGVVYRAEGDLFDPGALRRGDAVGPLDEVELLTPVQPGKIVAVGLNYALHVTENDPTRQVPDEPVLFMKPTSALLPHGGVILLPPGNRIDHEAELCIVIGRRASRVPEAQALDYVLGYTCGNDVSHRDYQRKDGQWVRAKGFDTFCPLGPVIATDLDPNDLAIQSRLNGEVRQNSRTSNMIFSPVFLVSFISNVMTLEPGDVIMTGTPEGVGPMQPGDTIEVEIEGIGTLRNTTRARD